MTKLRFAAVLAVGCVSALLADGVRAENAAARLVSDVEYLASEKLEGRGIDTPGIFLAAEHIIERFREVGVAPGSEEGYLQRFSVPTGWKTLADQSRLQILTPDGDELVLKIGEDYQPMVFGDEGAFSAPIVFVGYGITDEKIGYDDYDGVDVEGKVVLMMRREPQQDDPDSPFDGVETTNHSAINTKVQNAWVHKVKAILLCNDPATVEKEGGDELVKTDHVPNKGAATIPMAHVTLDVANRLLKHTDLESIQAAEKAIDEDLKPRSIAITDSFAEGEYRFERVTLEAANVVGVIEGDGPSAKETIVIGAHYDHLGYGGRGSLAPGVRAIHPGADDNASGTAVLMELARRYALRDEKPARRLVFIAFSAEERGLIGSRHYVRKDPWFSLEDTVAMVNFDMVGRMQDDQLTVFGVKTGKDLEKQIDAVGADRSLELKTVDLGARNSDHASFYDAKIPAIHLFTGIHEQYHRPTDASDLINADGMAKVTDFSEQLIDRLLAMSERLEYVEVKSSDPHAGLDLPMKTGARPYLGTIPDYAAEVEGAKLQDVPEGSPGAKGGLKPGDVVVELAGLPVKNVEHYAQALYAQKGGETIKIVVVRDGEEKTLDVKLGVRKSSDR